MNSKKKGSKSSTIKNNPSHPPKDPPSGQVIPFKRAPKQTSPHSSSPELSPEDLLDQFQKRFFESRYQIRQLELKITALEHSSRPDAALLEDLKLESEALIQRERTWIQKLSLLIMSLRDEKEEK